MIILLTTPYNYLLIVKRMYLPCLRNCVLNAVIFAVSTTIGKITTKSMIYVKTAVMLHLKSKQLREVSEEPGKA